MVASLQSWWSRLLQGAIFEGAISYHCHLRIEGPQSQAHIERTMEKNLNSHWCGLYPLWTYPCGQKIHALWDQGKQWVQTNIYGGLYVNIQQFFFLTWFIIFHSPWIGQYLPARPLTPSLGSFWFGFFATVAIFTQSHSTFCTLNFTSYAASLLLLKISCHCCETLLICQFHEFDELYPSEVGELNQRGKPIFKYILLVLQLL